jgi:excisionase family DNA binding protein
MSTEKPNADGPAFYTVREAARLLRVGQATLYRAIREGAFPAVRVRSRYVVPAIALHKLINQATESGTCIDLNRRTAEHRTAREIARLAGGASW